MPTIHLHSYSIERGLEIDEKKAKHFYELAAIGGSLHGRYHLACLDGQAGNDQRAFKHYILAARADHPESLDRVKKGFRNGQITKDEFKKHRGYTKRV